MNKTCLGSICFKKKLFKIISMMFCVFQSFEFEKNVRQESTNAPQLLVVEIFTIIVLFRCDSNQSVSSFQQTLAMNISCVFSLFPSISSKSTFFSQTFLFSFTSFKHVSLIQTTLYVFLFLSHFFKSFQISFNTWYVLFCSTHSNFEIGISFCFWSENKKFHKNENVFQFDQLFFVEIVPEHVLFLEQNIIFTNFL